MNTRTATLPRILIIDDLFGRSIVGGGRNEARAGLSAKYLLRDMTGDEECKSGGLRFKKKPLAEAIFHRGQTPSCPVVGDTVENDLEGCLRVVEAGWNVEPGELPWTLLLLDLCFYTGKVTEASSRKNLGMPEGRPTDDNPDTYFGLIILQAIQERFPELPVAILSSKPRDEVSKQFSACGALGFLDRSAPESGELLRDYLWRHGLMPDWTGTICGYSKSILLTLRSARRMAGSRRNILVRGPRGSGKGIIAKYIHDNSAQSASSYVPVNLGGTNPNLFESLLFGHVKGAFTGANADRRGFIEEANKGTLFIDEIAGIPDQVQYGLLSILEDRKVTRVGSNKATAIDVHFISATNEDIEQRAASGKGFRSDLLDRLREGGTLIVPPLAERKEDIPILVEKFVREAEAQFTGAHHRAVAPEALEKLASHDWPGNVRELRQRVFEAVSENLDVEHLVPNHFHLPRPAVPASSQKTDGDVVAGTIPVDLATVLRLLSSFDFSKQSREELTGRLDELEVACRKFIAQYLKATLEKTLTPVGGEIQITPAIKMATGNAKIKTSRAADMIKRFLRGLDCTPETEEILRKALEIAFRLRPPRQSEK